jgi:hypothetical protein
MKNHASRALVATLVVFQRRPESGSDRRGWARNRLYFSTICLYRDGHAERGAARDVQLPQGNQLSVVDEHKHPTHLGDGRSSFMERSSCAR